MGLKELADGEVELLSIVESVTGLMEEKDKQLDQLSWMLPWYYQISDYAFPNLAKAPHLASFLASADPQAYLSMPPDERLMENRGQMGRYWDSVFNANRSFDGTL